MFPTAQPTPSECCIDNGFCSGDENTREIIPLYNLTDGSFDKPVIDGMIGDSPYFPGLGVFDEYSHLLELPMYIDGQTSGGDRVGTAHLGYDCLHNIVCAAASFDESYLQANPSSQINRNDDATLVRFGEDIDGTINLSASNSDEFAYIVPVGNSTTGFEGCWFLDTIPREPPLARSRRSLIDSISILNGFVEVYFGFGGDIASSGRPNLNGNYICLSPLCEESSDDYYYDDVVLA